MLHMGARAVAVGNRRRVKKVRLSEVGCRPRTCCYTKDARIEMGVETMERKDVDAKKDREVVGWRESIKGPLDVSGTDEANQGEPAQSRYGPCWLWNSRNCVEPAPFSWWAAGS